MSNPIVPPAESRAQKRVRLLEAARRAEQAINESLLESSETENDARRRRSNEEIERFLPGVTEDEQSPTGQYTPDPKYFAEGDPITPPIVASSEYFIPMRRTLAQTTADWSSQEEDEFRKRYHHHEPATGTGEWAKGLSPDELKYWSGHGPDATTFGGESSQQAWISGRLQAPGSTRHYEVPTTIDVGQDREDRIQLFRGGVVANESSSQEAPYEIDEENVVDWARKHRDEVTRTGEDDSEWKQRFNRLQEDVVKTLVPLSSGNTSNRVLQVSHQEKIDYVRDTHLTKLNRLWNVHSQDAPESPPPNIVSSSGRRRGSRRTDGPVRRNMHGVAESFVNQGDRGATTGRGSMTHVRGPANHGGRLNTSRLSWWQHQHDTSPDTLLSYDTPIAWRQEGGTVIVPTQSHSKTTNRHQSALRRTLYNSGYHSPQDRADNMLVKAYHFDRHRQTAGVPVAFKHYLPDHGAHEYTTSEERATEQASDIADSHYETVRSKQRENAAISGRRPNSRKPFTRAQQRRLEDAGQLRLPMSPNDESANRAIMEYPISLGYSSQVDRNAD